MLKRLLLSFALVASAAMAHAEVSVVKIINFSCPYCRTSETMDPPIRQAVEATGGKMVYATLPADENSLGERELVYYAARSVAPDKEPQIRESLYKGAQDLGYPLMTVQQTVEWLNTDLEPLKIDWVSVTQAAQSSVAKDAFARAMAITAKAGAQVTPTYIVLKDGILVRTLDVDSTGGSYAQLREAVMSAIEKAKAPSTPTN